MEQVDEQRFLTSVRGASQLKNFYTLQVNRHNTNPDFFVRGLNDRKIFVTFENNFRIIKMQEILDDDFLENVEYFFDVNVCEFPYPEIQQLRALEAFRRSQVRMPALKENILNLSYIQFKDSERRPQSIKNSSLLHNKNQMLAVIRSIAVEDFFMIQGSPGTGKTTVIKEIIWQ